MCILSNYVYIKELALIMPLENTSIKIAKNMALFSEQNLLTNISYKFLEF